MNTVIKQYMDMQKGYYENESILPEDIVGAYNWHENFPYESQLLYKRGDIRFPLFTNTKDKVALDFGCGPGRMVRRMSNYFDRVDGVDISKNLIDKAKKDIPNSNFYVSSGEDLGGTSNDTYDFIFSTIAMQHIAVHSIRMSILNKMKGVLKDGGKFTIQMAFNADYPYVINKGNLTLGNYKTRLYKKDTTHAFWKKDKVDANGTNGSCDVAIGYEDIPDVIEDFGKIFNDVDFWFYDVRLIFHNLNGQVHGSGSGYWPTHWIFISGTKGAYKAENKVSNERLRKIWTKKNNELNVRDKNSIFEIIKNILRKIGIYESLKGFYKKVITND